MTARPPRHSRADDLEEDRRLRSHPPAAVCAPPGSIVSGAGVSDRILGYQPWIHEDPALLDLGARWRAVDPLGDYTQVLTLAVPPVDELGEPDVALDLARAANDELAELVGRHPDRFAGFAAALPMSDAGAAAGELSRAMGELGALGRSCTRTSAGRRSTTRGSSRSSRP
jgi:predicted TIM-barrel fold metal-dependent hydrolase